MKTKEVFLNLDIRITFNNEETVCQQNVQRMHAFRPDYLSKVIHRYD